MIGSYNPVITRGPFSPIIETFLFQFVILLTTDVVVVIDDRIQHFLTVGTWLEQLLVFIGQSMTASRAPRTRLFGR